MVNKYDSHCTQPGCICDHNVSCYRGWRDTETETAPCPTCRPSTHDRWVRVMNARISGLPNAGITRIWTTTNAR